MNKSFAVFLSIFVTCLIVSITLIGFGFFAGPFIKEVYKTKNAMVATDSEICSIMGKNIMQYKNGNAFDATITTALCLGLVHPRKFKIQIFFLFIFIVKFFVVCVE